MISLLIRPEVPASYGLTPGRMVLFEDHTAGVFLTQGWGAVDDESQTHPAGRWWMMEGDCGGAHLLLRSGGFGDLICLRPSLEQMWEQRAELGITRLAVACHPAHAPALDGLPFLEVLPLPLPMERVAEFGWLLSLEGVIENDPASPQDSVELLARPIFGPLQPQTPTYTLPAESVADAWQRFPRGERPRVGIGLHSSALVRNWPMERLGELLADIGPDMEVFLFGAEGIGPQIALQGDLPHLHCLPHHGLSLRESLALLATMDAFIGPDSGLVHAAGAMQIPTLALFGAFEPRQRTTRYPTVQALVGRAPCAPCHHHPRTHEQTWPPGKPCQTHHHCIAMAGIRGADVAAKLRKMLPKPQRKE